MVQTVIKSEHNDKRKKKIIFPRVFMSIVHISDVINDYVVMSLV